MPFTTISEKSRMGGSLALAAVVLLLITLALPGFAQETVEAVESAPAADVAQAVEAAAPAYKNWGAFFGRTHVLMLHLPIGLLIGAFAIEFLGIFRRSRGYDIAAAWLFVFGALSAVLAVCTGLLLGSEQTATSERTLSMFQVLFADAEDGASQTMQLHMWLGVALMVVAIIGAVLKVAAVSKQWGDDPALPKSGGWPLILARLGILGCMAALPLVGHLGGNMTHGPEFLTERAPSEGIKSAINLLNLGTDSEANTVENTGDAAAPQGSVAFWNANIQPALNDHCVACHGPTKQNGKLRLDSIEFAVAGKVIQPGDAEFSEMYRRVMLPPSHEEFMPTNTKKYGMMSQAQTQALGDWLQAFDGKLESEAVAVPAPNVPESDPKPEPAAVVEPAFSTEELNKIASAGGIAQSVSLEQDADLLTVKFAYLKTLSPENVKTIEPVASNVASLTFEGSALDDAAASALTAMPKLTRLNLKDTKITDAGLSAMPKLETLEWLNLFGTGVTDNAIEGLKKYPTLKKLYLTGTAVTADGVAKIRAALPNTEVYSDHDGAFVFGPIPEAPKPQNEQKPQEPEADDTTSADQPVNDKCPVSGADINAGFVSTFDGKTIGFCCEKCKAKFDAEPTKFAAKLPQ